ncbi:MAG: orotate phosphoribosyltransferase [Thiotrichaceae bacterium]|nr:orotate phosphoribosyltransferase [Thiotrichaceae bacterium]
MIFNKETAAQVANSLLQIKAIKLNNEEPFTWASGLRSPIYCDNRKSLSFPKIRTYIRQELAKAITDKFGDVDVIAGVATAGIPQGALVAQELGLPFVYVRSSKKEHGMTNMIEGVLNKGQSVVVIEDLVSTGKSSINAVVALREAGAKVKGMAAIFSYGLPIAIKNLKDAACPLVTLSDYNSLIKEAVENSYINDRDRDSLLTWKSDPQAWSDAVTSA